MVKADPSETSAQIYVTTRKEFFEFKVAACMNVKVILISELRNENTTYYEFGIGFSDNSKITIYDSKSG